MNHQSNQMLGGMSSSGDYAGGNSGTSGMSHQSNQMSGSTSSSGSYASGNSGMNHHPNQMLGSVSGGYSLGSAQRNMLQSTGTGSQRSMNLRSSSLSSGSRSQSVPEIGYLEEEISEVDNSNTVFIQNHGSTGNNGMQNHGISGMQNLGSSGSYGMQNHGSSGSVGMQNHASSSSGISEMNYLSVGYY